MEKPRQMTIRLPGSVRQRIGEHAARNRRSVNAELEVLLTEAMDARDRREAGQAR